MAGLHIEIAEIHHLVQAAKFLDRCEDGDSFQICVAKMMIGKDSVMQTVRFLQNKKIIKLGTHKNYHGYPTMHIERIDDGVKSVARAFLKEIAYFQDFLNDNGKADTARLARFKK